VIQVEGITKRFPRVLANNDVSLKVSRGEVHALIGENGAGKSTLMNIIYGLTRPDSGRVLLDGKPLPVSEGFLGIDHGIGMIHQHFMLIGQFTALENIVLGSEPGKGLFLDTDTARSRVEHLMNEFGIEVDLDRKIDDLSVGEEQRVEILKVLYRDARIIIMDEPTAVLTPQETRGLFATLKTLTAGGRTVIFISHKLQEVMEVARTVTVLRAGGVIDSMPVAETDPARLAELMVGRSIETVSGRRAPSQGEPVLAVEDLSLLAGKGHELLSGVSFSVRRGEIFGIAGVDGNGQDELFEVLIGLRQPSAGRVEFLGRDVSGASTRARMAAGMAHIPPDRIRMGLVTRFSMKQNLILGRHAEEAYAGRVFLKQGNIDRSADRLIRDYEIEPAAPEIAAGLLSGGNQQKVIAAREISRNPELLIASQPTRGLDIGAAERIRGLLIKQAAAGKAVLLISADLSEIINLSDRIGVMYRGQIVGVVPAGEATEEGLGLMMAGVSEGGRES
jgi:simple sugar transport system ATP-binding protein